LKRLIGTLIIAFAITTFSDAQNSDSLPSWKHWKTIVKGGSFYGSWGYNEETYTHSNLYVVQPGMQNNYVFNNIRAQDRIGWDHLFTAQPTIPQYNYRLGYFFDKKQVWAIELNFDHTKYVVEQGYDVRVNGTMHGRNVDTMVNLNNSTLRYQLNNGANFFLFNLVRKITIFSTRDKKFIIDGLIKAGVGPLVPHVDNSIFDEQNRRQFQLGGWNTGAEATIKMTFFKHVYVEYCNKVDYARYSWLEINGGRAHQDFGTYENILNIGYTLHFHKVKPAEVPVTPAPAK
jgi:hypothetical protein